MAVEQGTYETLSERLWRTETAAAAALKWIVLAFAGALIITIAAKIKVPFWPVHMSMQTAAILLIGAAYGWRLGTLTVLLYIAQGAMGLPVFQGTPERGIGIPYMLGPTGGYLVGYVMTVGIVGWFAERGYDRSFAKIGPVMLLAGAVLYIPGLLWLAYLFGADKPILAWGLYPFILGDLTKVALAAAITALGWRLFPSVRG